MGKSKKFFAAFLVLSSGLFFSMREVRADIPVPPLGGDTSIGAGTLFAAAVVVLVIAILSYLLLRRIRKRREKDAYK